MGILSTVIGLLFPPAEAGSASAAGTAPGPASATALAGTADPFADPLAPAAQGADAREYLDWRATFFDYM
ncbi:MAG: hypothetical protein V4505_13190 [Pseudomonadota bacterium]